MGTGDDGKNFRHFLHGLPFMKNEVVQIIVDVVVEKIGTVHVGFKTWSSPHACDNSSTDKVPVCLEDISKAAYYIWNATMFGAKERLSEAAPLSPLSISDTAATRNTGTSFAFSAASPSFLSTKSFILSQFFLTPAAGYPLTLGTCFRPLMGLQRKLSVMSVVGNDRTKVLMRLFNKHHFLVKKMSVKLKHQQEVERPLRDVSLEHVSSLKLSLMKNGNDSGGGPIFVTVSAASEIKHQTQCGVIKVFLDEILKNSSCFVF